MLSSMVSCVYAVSHSWPSLSSSYLSVLGSVDYEDAFKAAVLMNVYNKRAAAASHLCLAWSQLVDVCVLGCGGVLTTGTALLASKPIIK